LKLRITSVLFCLILSGLTIPGVLLAKAPDLSSPTSILIDASETLAGPIGDKTKAVAFTSSLVHQLQKQSAFRINSIRVYANGEKGQTACKHTRLMGSYNAKELEPLEKLMLSHNPSGKVSMTSILDRFIEKHGTRADTNRIIYVAGSRGGCVQDICRHVKSIEAKGYKLRIDVIGLDQSDKDKKFYQCITKQTGGIYLNVKKQVALDKVIAHMLKRTERNATDKVASTKLEFGENISSGEPIKIKWTGPANPFDRIMISSLDQELDYSYSYVRKKIEFVNLPSPNKAGKYQIKYVTGVDGKVLSSRIVNVIPIHAKIDSPKAVVAGSHFTVDWRGPSNEYDQIRVVDPGKPKDMKSQTFTRLCKDNKAKLLAPEKPGRYEVRYITKTDRVLARSTIQVTRPDISLSADSSVVAGSVFSIYWQGPKNPNDQIRLVDPSTVGKDNNPYKVLGQTYTANEKQKSELQAPEKPGHYVIQYVSAKRKVLATLKIEVVKALASFKPMNPVAAGSKVRVSWYGPNNEFDRIILVDPKHPDKMLTFTYAKINKMKWAYLEVPETPGEYQVIYKTKKNKILARETVEVHPVSATINPIEYPVKAGTNFEVSWQGPMNQYDQLQIKNGEADAKPLSFIFVNRYRNNRVRLVAPLKAGIYQIIYLTSKKKILATTKLIVKK
jgi:Ca-activated chloride channel family protein